MNREILLLNLVSLWGASVSPAVYCDLSGFYCYVPRRKKSRIGMSLASTTATHLLYNQLPAVVSGGSFTIRTPPLAFTTTAQQLPHLLFQEHRTDS